MKNNMTIKGWKVSELLMGLYIAAVLVGMPLFVTLHTELEIQLSW